MRDEIVELIEKVAKLPTLEERVEARNAVLDKLDENKWDFRDPADFSETYECDNCGHTFEDWEPEPGFQQPPSMPMRPFCRPCWDELAEHRWVQSRWVTCAQLVPHRARPRAGRPRIRARAGRV